MRGYRISALAVTLLPRIGWVGVSGALVAGLGAQGRPGAALLVLLAAILPIVVGRPLLPEFSRLSGTDDHEHLRALYHRACGLLGSRPVDVGIDDDAPVGGKTISDGLTDPACRPGHQAHLPQQV